MLRSLFWKIFTFILIANLLAMMLAVYFFMPPSNSKEFYEIRKEAKIVMAKTIIGRMESGQPLNVFLPDQHGIKGPIPIRFLAKKLLILDDQNKVLFGDKNPQQNYQHVFFSHQTDSGRQYRIGIEESHNRSIVKHLFRPRQIVRFAILFLTTLLVSFIISLLIVRPLKQLGKHTRSLSEGNMHSRVEQCLLKRNDEIGDLSRELNEMANTLDNLINSKQQLLHDVSHELRAPLSRLQAIAAIMHQRKSNGSSHATVERIERECTRMNTLIEEILEYSRLHYGLENKAATLPVNLSTLFKSIVINIQDEYPTHPIKLHRIDERLSIKGHKNKLDRAFENILRNACKHTPERTSIDINVQRVNEYVEIQIRDYGPGIKEADLAVITTPFVRGDGIKHTVGYGLGLSISQRIIKHYRGILNISNHPDKGLLISVIFPTV